MSYFDGTIGRSFRGAFCFDNDKVRDYGRNGVKNKECICAKNYCNSATSLDDTEEAKLMKLIDEIKTEVQSLKSSSSTFTSPIFSVVHMGHLLLLYYFT